MLMPYGTISAEPGNKDWGVTAFGGFSKAFSTFETAPYFFAGRTIYPQAELQMTYSTRPSNSDKYAEAYNYPTFGIGVTWSGLRCIEFQPNAHLDDLISLYGFMERDFYKLRKFSVGYDFRFGLGFTTARYDPVTNPNNIIFGSAVTFCIGFGINAKWRPIDQLELILRGNVRHHSVGRWAYPNHGLNEAGCELGVRYYASAPHTKQTEHTMRNEFERKWSWFIQAGGGVHHCSIEWDAANKAAAPNKVSSIPGWPKFFCTASATYRYSLKLSSGIGIDTFWTTPAYMNRLRESDVILNGQAAVDACRGYDPFSCGISFIQNFHFGNFSLSGCVGVYLYKRYGINEQLSWSYQRIGLRYDFPSLGGLFLSCICKSHYFTRAEMLELGVGMKIH